MGLQVTEKQSKNERVISLPFKPGSEKQDQFIHTDKPKAALVGTTASGKTVALCMRSWALSYKYPGNRGVLAMYTYDQIKQALIPKWKECVPRELMINPEVLDRADIASQTLLIHTQDPEQPSEILFRNLEDYHKFESVEIGWFGICQANDPKITRRTWDYLNERLRWPVPYHFAYLEGNYGGNASKGGWIWDEFLNQKAGPIWEVNTFDNWENLSEDYRTRLASVGEVRRIHAIVGGEGAWDPLIDIKGKPVYPEFKFGWHVGEAAEPGDVRELITSSRPVIRGIDVPGPGACVWVQTDERGRLLVAHELAMDMAIGARELADIIQSESASFFPGCRFFNYIDPSAMRVEQTSGTSIAQVLYAQGIPCRPGATQIEKRLQPVKDWLTQASHGDASMLIDRGCYRLVNGFMGGYFFPQLGSDPGRVADVPNKNDHSHVHDALQYACEGVRRLQYSQSHTDDELPMPTRYLGSLRRR